MDKQYTTIQQHEPLRVPSDWSAQGRRLVAQIEEILDDLYRRFNRIRLSDLNAELRSKITATDEILLLVQHSSQTFTQPEQPEECKRGDIWVQTISEGDTSPQTRIYDGEKWVLISDPDAPAAGVQNTAVVINANGVHIKTGGIFTVDSGNFALDNSGNMSAQNAYLSGSVFVSGCPALSTYDIVPSTNPPENPHVGMLWVKPDTSTSAQTTFSQQVPWDIRQSLSAYPKSGELTGVATDPVGEQYTYRIKVPIFLREYSEMETGGTLHFDVATASGGVPVLAVEQNVSISLNGSGNRVIEFEVTSDVWLGANSKLYYTMYATRVSGQYLANVLNSMDNNASVQVECISRSSSGAAGWRDCKVYSYA